jgi:uncharacterized protein (TIGR03437 family)
MNVQTRFTHFALVLGLLVSVMAGCAASPCLQSNCVQTVQASNRSTPTQCAEDDNLNIYLRGPVASFIVEATHPTYPIANDTCAADFRNCQPGSGGYSFTPLVVSLYDDGQTVVEAVREASFWRPVGMNAAINNTIPRTNIHYIRVYRKVTDANSWPQFFVLYADGNMRLIPHPPAGASSVCFGSSVIIGPAAPAERPIAEIAGVIYRSATQKLEVTYRAGGSATLDLSEVNRQIARVHVAVNYPTDLPFATFRSMFVTETNADAARVSWTDTNGNAHDDPILSFTEGHAKEWFFSRRTLSQHNSSAPDIRIKLEAYKAKSVSGASYQDIALAPESIASVFGTCLATVTQAAGSLPLPLTLGGTMIRLRDSFNVERLAPIFYVSPTQINYLIPAGTMNGTAEVTITNSDGAMAKEQLQIAPVAPGLFSADATGQGLAAAMIQRVKADGSQTVEPITQLPIDLGPEGEQVFLNLFGTGIRFRSSLTNVRAQIGGVEAEVVYAGPQGEYVGLDQINIRIPRTLIGRGTVNVALIVDGKAANIVTITIK